MSYVTVDIKLLWFTRDTQRVPVMLKSSMIETFDLFSIHACVEFYARTTCQGY